MKRNTFKIAVLTMAILTFSLNSRSQFFQNPAGGNWRIDNSVYNVGRVSLSTGTSYPYAFFIDGANLSTNTGDVFGTDAPSATATAWYMRMGGNVIGKFWNGGTNNELNIGTIQTSTNPHLNFFTANAQRMTILGSTNPGFAGIGYGFTPNFKLDVDSGDINLNDSTSAYRIGKGAAGRSYKVLWHNGNPVNLFVGVGAGNTNTFWSNTFVGYNAGTNNSTNANSNTFIGHAAGSSNTSGNTNSFLGDSAGFSNTGGERNTFIGTGAGFSNLTGLGNIFVGGRAGYNSTGDYNVMVGRNAGYENKYNWNCFYGKDAGFANHGNANCFYGHHAGIFTDTSEHNSAFGYLASRNIIGFFNCFFGNLSGDNLKKGNFNTYYGAYFGSAGPTDTLYNSGGFGYNVFANSDYKIIVGNNNNRVGIGLSDDTIFLGPRSKLEINADSTSMTVPASPTAGSGLQFRQLTSFSPTGTNSDTWVAPYGQVLTVDSNGKVKLTDDIIGFGYGICNTPSVLSSDISMKLDTNRIYYEGNSQTLNPNDMHDAIGLGYTCADTLPGKLSVNQVWTSDNVLVNTTAGFFHNGDYSNCPPAALIKRSIHSICDGPSLITDGCGRFDFTNIAGDFEVRNSDDKNIGVQGRAFGSSGSFGLLNVGGWFEGNNSQKTNIGVRAKTLGGGNINYGIYASVPVSVCTTGVGTCSSAAGFFNGDVYTTTAYWVSDENLKDNIHPLQNAMAVINALNPKSFTFRTSQFPFINMPNTPQDGLIAQEVLNVTPNLVSSFKIPADIDSLGNSDTTGTGNSYLSVNYVGFIPYLIQALKEEHQSKDSMRIQMAVMQSQIDNCCGAGLRMGNNNQDPNNQSTINVELTNINTIILESCSPNPFSEETYINYTVPKEVSKASIMIYDNSGQVLRTIIINERGNGTIHIYAEKLSSGVYSYSLIADGKTIDTKQMVCQK